ncbi:hypothetical protein BAUCODRAFT_33834 [Baudoinia panamericana UAMH 10762]|uniref:Uncharacterized protein n=1 Tax=Baudoinia panamericana (strain UAMH 10762) TaxID=717646 RepID=M2LPZ5_BAUPA|nr:uncharacterized protein BAUCODRAFT_33834 [Baudoinia panamericana UAMH 10762]EMC96477.1 hypothetical protein BAUCODRAFT_33834 [Baudoinia panamericana UAMH 10762]
MRVLDNSVVNFEIFPGKSEQQVQGEGQDQAQGAAQTTQAKGEETASSLQGEGQDVSKQAQGQAQSYTQIAQEQAHGLRKQVGDYQQQGAGYIKSTGDAAHAQSLQYVDGATAGAHGMVKNNLPESTHGYAGQAVDYASNFATGTVGTLGGAVKDVGDTVGNAGYETVAGLGKTGYNLASGLGSAVTGGGNKVEEGTKAESKDDTTGSRKE